MFFLPTLFSPPTSTFMVRTLAFFGLSLPSLSPPPPTFLFLGSDFPPLLPPLGVLSFTALSGHLITGSFPWLPLIYHFGSYFRFTPFKPVFSLPSFRFFLHVSNKERFFFLVKKTASPRPPQLHLFFPNYTTLHKPNLLFPFSLFFRLVLTLCYFPPKCNLTCSFLN